jgi:hypothetical protein
MKKSVNLILMAFLPAIIVVSCNKDKTGDFIPLNVGAKYIYELHSSYAEASTVSHAQIGECEWTITSLNTDVDTADIYYVQQVFNGIYIKHVTDVNSGETISLDTIIVENEVVTGSITEYSGGRIEFQMPGIYSGLLVRLYRYHETSDNVICDGIFSCLRKNVGITSLLYMCFCIHNEVIDYKLKKGPYQ